MPLFKLKSDYRASPAQETAARKILEGLKKKNHPVTLLGVTGSGKTFTMAKVIEKWGAPALVISHNKTLAAQLYTEFRSFFPSNAVCYFVSYYDYYQPEAYIPQSDTYIAKDASINDQIDRLRLQATASLLSRKDVLIVATVSCIYGIGSPDDWSKMTANFYVGQVISPSQACRRLARIQYARNDFDFSSGRFRLKGNILDIFPPYARNPVRIVWELSRISRIYEFEMRGLKKIAELKNIPVYPAKFFITTAPRLKEAVKNIKKELRRRVAYFRGRGQLLEAERLLQRTNYDIEMLEETGYCHGIENYSRHLSGRLPGEPPQCLIDYFPKNFLTIIDESHVTLPQLRGMYRGDYSRKKTLVEFGFRLPSAIDNRPLKFSEFEGLVDKLMYVSATPADYEIKRSRNFVVEQLIRPTGLTDPEVIVRSQKNAVEDVKREILRTKRRKERALIITLTKRMAEDLSFHLTASGIKTRYLHSDIDTLDRIKILNELRKGTVDCIVGVNLLREGLDLPEVSLVAILDADKEGFLRSRTSLIQIAGRSARNVSSRVIFYADVLTRSMEEAIAEMKRRRRIQEEYNRVHGITPATIRKNISIDETLIKENISKARETVIRSIEEETGDKARLLDVLRRDLDEAVDKLDFELAIILRDKIFSLGGKLEKEKKK
ncbi:MAG: excinuclease ABC subunit UvrB [Elusimicrobia bacterium]|nr:excinuclease ABC subunit UvrB [Elusimicrobiota bacterium]